jgi:hypothetical protein
MEGHCWTGQSPLWAVEPMEEEVIICRGGDLAPTAVLMIFLT